MHNKKLSLDVALEFILNGNDSELESLSEDSDAEDFDVSSIATDDLENTLFIEVLQPEKEMNDDEVMLKWRGTTTSYKTKQSVKTHQEKLCLGEKEFSKHR